MQPGGTWRTFVLCEDRPAGKGASDFRHGEETVEE